VQADYVPNAYDAAGRPIPTEIRLKSAEKALEVDFSDGRKFRFNAEFLRVYSPSAEVRGHGPGQRVVVPGRRHVNIIGIEPVGTYAVVLKFDDLHDTGIFSWEYFYTNGQVQERLWAEYEQELATRGLSRDPPARAKK
jgi:DUF971 family protein